MQHDLTKATDMYNRHITSIRKSTNAKIIISNLWNVSLFVSSSNVFMHRLSAYAIFWMDRNTMYQHAVVDL